MSVKEGKKPLKSKPSLAQLQDAAGFVNTLALGPELEKELKTKGLRGRFADYKRLKENDGLHTKGWQIYKRDKRGTIDSQEFRIGSDPNGYVRRGSVVLVVKTEAAWQAHRDLLDYRAQTQKKNFVRQKAAELRQMAKDRGIKTNVVEGYDD